jgi:SAM-dependent methyltransferase
VSRSLLDEHRRVWEGKPALRAIYGLWFDLLLAEAPPGGRALEIGSGPGFLGAHARRTRPDLRLLETDILATPWQDAAADSLRLPLRRESMDTMLGVDVVHHLARPARLFSEAARVLVPGGRLVFVEPWVTPLSYPIYRWLHQEGCRLDLDPWNPFGLSGDAGKDAFQGDAAVVWRLVRTTLPSLWRDLGFEPPRVTVLNGLAYLLSLGFKRGSLLPPRMTSAMLRLDAMLVPWAAGLGLRVLVVWDRAGHAGDTGIGSR